MELECRICGRGMRFRSKQVDLPKHKPICGYCTPVLFELIAKEAPNLDAMFALIKLREKLYEQSRIKTIEGLRKAKEKGIMLGRPAKKHDIQLIENIKTLRSQNKSYREIGMTLGIGRQTAFRILNRR